MSKSVCLGRTSLLLLLIISCLVSLKGNCQKATSANTASSNNECEEEIRLICRGMGSLEVLFWFTDGIRLPINTSDFATEPSFISISVTGSSSHARARAYGYAYGIVTLNPAIVNVSQGKLKADILMANFEKFLNMTLPYDGNRTLMDIEYRYTIGENEPSVIQKFIDLFMEHKPSQGFDKIVTPTLLEHAREISFRLRRETGNLTWKTDVTIYVSSYISEEWFSWLGKEYTISLKELADYSGNIDASPYSARSILSIRFSNPGAFLQICPKEEVRCLEIVPSQMNVSRRGEVFEKDITGSSVEDLYIRFKWAMPWWSLIGVTIVILGVGAFIIGFGINPLKNLFEKIPTGVLGFLFFVGFIIGCMFVLLIILNIVFLSSPSIAFNLYGWTGFGVWLGIWIAIAVEVVFPIGRELKERKEGRKKALAKESEGSVRTAR